MPLEAKPMTAAAKFARVLAVLTDPDDRRLHDLAQLALERALVRDNHWFRTERRGPLPPEIRAAHVVDVLTVVSPVSDGAAADCRHVVDWLKASVANRAAWLDRVDSEGRPLKLMKIGSLARAVAEADKEMRRASSRSVSVLLSSGDESIEAELADGWTVVRLLTPAALDRESGLMQHCIGQGAYDRSLEDGSRAYFSLRDPSGRPHVTVERNARDDMLMQFQGKQNAHPLPEYARRMRPWVMEHCTVPRRLSVATGVLRDAHGRKVDLDDMPESIEILGDLDLTRFAGVLPERLTVSGSLVLPARVQGGIVDCEIYVGRDLFVVEGDVAEFLRPVRVGNVLSITGCPIHALHPQTIVGHGLVLKDLPNLRALPDGIVGEGRGVLEGKLVAERTGLRSLHPLRELGSLDLTDCPIRTLPAGLTVRGNTSLVRCLIRTLPGDTGFLGSVSVAEGDLERVERNTFHAGLEISKCPGRSDWKSAPSRPSLVMEDGIVVRERLMLEMVVMENGLPGDLDVGSLVIVSGSYGTGAGKVRVRQDAEISISTMDGLPADFSCGGDLSLRGGRIGTIGAGLDVGGDLRTENTSVGSIGANCRIAGRVRGLAPAGLETIGPAFSIGTLGPRSFPASTVFGEGMRVGILREPEAFRGRLPEGLVVDGDLDLSSFEPDEVPDRLVVGGTLTPPARSPSLG